MAQISVAEFEAKVLEQEEIVIKVRAPSGAKVSDYKYERKAAGSQSTTDWLEGRIKPLLSGHEVVVIDGDYTTPHGRTKLDRLRKSYEK
ncbi:MAG: hypothetical protein FIA97_06175 [Methylococcaceae bacterium]|nr:hypothetical protein [Methylococcaceae bacterium]